MLSTAIGIQFKVNDLDAKYEVYGSSDNYSFNYDLGRGSDLVNAEGETAQKSIGLNGNYGSFEVRVFAVSDIGVRSAFVQDEISVSPPEFNGTFSFSDIKISNLPELANVGSSTEIFPGPSGNILAVNSEYVGRNVELEWRLTPPIGHPKEGQSLGNELLSDSFLSHFSIQIRNSSNGNLISSSELDNSAHRGLQRYLNSTGISQSMDEYRSFSFAMSPAVFDELNLDRELSVQVLCHDKFGNISTGVITGQNYLPQIEDLTHSMFGSKVGFAWTSSDTDYESVEIRGFSIPEDQELYDPVDFDENISHYEKISSAPRWLRSTPSWSVGDCCEYEGSYYKCISSYNRIDIPNGTPKTLVSNWQVQLDFSPGFVNATTSENNISLDQTWGYKYYYSFRPSDEYGQGGNFNVTESGAFEGGDLHGFNTSVRIANLNFIEREDDLIFRWNVVDQDENLVDLNQYKFLVSPNDSPSVLGISGSLFDPVSNDHLTGITEGLSARSSTLEDGVSKISEDLPGAKVFETFEFTRELNNILFEDGGFPSNASSFTVTGSYTSGDSVKFDRKLFDASISPGSTIPELVFPEYDPWSSSENYYFKNAQSLSENSVVQYSGGIYVTTGSSNDQIVGPDASNVDGVFDFQKNYSAGSVVISPSDSSISAYDPSLSYTSLDRVSYEGYIYRSVVGNNSGNTPGQSTSHWVALTPFSSVDCDMYKSTSQTVGQNPVQNPSVWELQTPESSSEYERYIDPYPLYIPTYETGQGYDPGDLVIRHNDIFKAQLENGGGTSAGTRIPGSTFPDNYWTNEEGGSDIITNHSSGDLALAYGIVYECLADNPTGAPLLPGTEVDPNPIIQNSNFEDCQWRPFWQQNTGYSDIPFGFVGIPESGSREVGIELAILDPRGDILDLQRLVGFNLEPSILANGFKVDSLEKVTTTRFDFRYANEAREMVNRLQMYRSSDPYFSITGESGLPGSGSPNFVKEVFGPTEQNFGENINSIIDDNPPLPYTHENKTPDSRGDGITGYYYKLLPFDEFGSGDIFTLRDNQGQPERVLIYPFHYSNSNPDGFMGPAFGKTTDAIPGVVENFEGDTAFVNYFLDWEIPKSEFLEGSGTLLSLPNDISHYEVWQSEDNYLYFGAENEFLKHDRNVSGYRKITGDLTSIADEIPIEEVDPASGITNALHVRDASAMGPQMSITHRGQVNDKRYFWVRAVDHGGNKGPFTGKAGTSDTIEGLELILGQQEATDIHDFEQSITQTFPNTLALVPNNPFNNRTPDNDSISWDRHYLYMEGTGYVIGGGSTDDQYVYFTGSSTELNQSQKEQLGLADAGEKVKLYEGSVTANPSFNSFDVSSQLISQPSFSQITSTDSGHYIKFTSGDLNGQEREIDTYDSLVGTITTKRPFVGSPDIDDPFQISREVPLSLEQNNPLRDIFFSGNYNTVDYHPAGEGVTGDPSNMRAGDSKADVDASKSGVLKDGDKIIARNAKGIATPMWHAFANATIGTAHIQDAAISNAKIHNLTADKIRSAEIMGQDIQIGGDLESGQIRSAGFGILDTGTNGFDGHNYPNSGFAISGNGSFIFKGDDVSGPGGKLYYENGQLTIEGNLKQRDGTELAVVNMYANPDVFYYDENAIGDFVPNPSSQQIVVKNNWLNSSLNANEIRFKMERAEDGSSVFDYDEFGATESNGVFEISGFRYDTANFDFNSKSSFATLDLDNNGDGFDSILRESAFDNLGVIIYASGIGRLTEASVSVNMSLQGPVGETGRSPVFRGVWKSTEDYMGVLDGNNPYEELRGDVVYHVDTNYYIAVQNSGPSHGGDKVPSSNADYWQIFGAQFESVATSLLLAEDAIITRTLTIGNSDPNNPFAGSAGTIESDDFIGGLSEVDGSILATERYGPTTSNPTDVAGFRLKVGPLAGDPFSFVIFDVGGKYSVPINTGGSAISVDSFIRFSSSTGKVEIHGASFNGSIDDPSVTDNLNNLNNVASNFSSFIGGGIDNKFETNTSGATFPSIAAAIVAGAKNTIKGRFSFIGAGYNNSCKDTFSVICGGHTNSMPLDSDANQGSNVIGAGRQNKIEGGSNQGVFGGVNNHIIYDATEVLDREDSNDGGTHRFGNSPVVPNPDTWIACPKILGEGTDYASCSFNYIEGWFSTFLVTASGSTPMMTSSGGAWKAGWGFATNLLGCNMTAANNPWFYMVPAISTAEPSSHWFWFNSSSSGLSGWFWTQEDLIDDNGLSFVYSDSMSSWVVVQVSSRKWYQGAVPGNWGSVTNTL